MRRNKVEILKMIMDTSITNKILTFFPPDFTDVAASSFEVKRKKNIAEKHICRK